MFAHKQRRERDGTGKAECPTGKYKNQLKLNGSGSGIRDQASQ